MSRQHWQKKVRLLDLSGRSSYITELKAQEMIDAGDAEVLYETPLTIRIIDKVGYQDELHRETGRSVKVSSCPSRKDFDANKARKWVTGFSSTRCKTPRHRIPEVEREFQRYKTGFLRRQSEEEADRVKLSN